ncbi:MAG: hypothetical protein LBL00_05390, partial [Endomicrobium sp.]|nr:hypothetical protein [Endomicrobium sp.]
ILNMKNPKQIKPSVLVQEMVENVAKAGVIFTRDIDGYLSIETVYGLGGNMMSGDMNPDRIAVSSSGDISYARAIDNTQKLVSLDGGGTALVSLTETEQKSRVLSSENMIKKMMRIAYDIEKMEGYPVDIEFAVDDNNIIYIVQIRPITTFVSDDINFNTAKTDDIENKKVSQRLEEKLKNTLIDKLVKDLRSIYVKTDAVNTALEVLSKISDSLSPAEKDNILFEQLNAVFSSVKKENDNIILAIVPLSLFVNDTVTENPLFMSILDFVGNNYDKKSFSLQRMMYSMFKMAYPLNSGYALKIIERMFSERLMGNKEIPNEIKETIKDYDDIKKYYLAMADKDIDVDMAAVVSKFSDSLKAVELPAADEKIKSEDVKEIDIIEKVINPSTSPILRHKTNSLFLLALKYMKKEDDRGLHIFNALLPVYKMLVEKNEYIEFNDLYELSQAMQYLYKDAESLNDLISFIFFANEKLSGRNVYLSKRISALLYDIAKKMRNDMSKIPAENPDMYLSVLKKLSENNPLADEIQSSMPYDFGFNSETISIILEGSRRNGHKYFPRRGYAEDKINITEETALLLVNNMDAFALDEIIKQLFYSGDKGKKAALLILDKIIILAENVSESKKRRAAAADILAKSVSSFYGSLEDDVKVGSERINNIFRQLQMNAELIDTDASVDPFADSAVKYYAFSNFIKKLPAAVLRGKKVNLNSPVYFYSDGYTEDDRTRLAMTKEFEVLQDILKTNVLALNMLNNLSVNSTKKEVGKVLSLVSKMAAGLKEINAKSGNDALKALENIGNAVDKYGFSQEHFLISDWNDANIAGITSINALINAVHQTGINYFRKNIAEIKQSKKGGILSMTAEKDAITISAYDLSDSGAVDQNIKKLILKLASGKISVDDLIYKDDLLVWSTQLYAHSVDIFFNLGKEDGGISINYTEGTANKATFGNAKRLQYFANVLNALGFKTELNLAKDASDPKADSLKAVLNKDTGLNQSADLPEIAFKVIMLFKYSVHMNHMFNEMIENHYVERKAFDKDILLKLVEKFMAGEIWYKYDYADMNAFLSEDEMTERLPFPDFKTTADLLNGILTYLEIAPIEYEAGMKIIDTVFVEENFNKPIERAFIEGRIKIDETGELVAAKDYDIMGDFLSSLAANPDKLIEQSRTLNLVGEENFDYRTLGFVGKLKFVSGVYRLPDGRSLFIRGLMNPLTKRMKFVLADLVTLEKRETLNNEALLSFFSNEGYEIYAGQEKTEIREMDKIIKQLMSSINIADSPEIFSTPTSDGNGTYVAGDITFDRKNAGENEILAVPYTTPDDMEAIKSSKAVITTGGGLLSHAAITAREFKKPSVVLNNSVWNKSKTGLETQYYEYENDEQLHEYNIKRVKEKKIKLSKGARVLLNGETGSILVFADIDAAMLNELQSYIDSGNTNGIERFFRRYRDDKNILRLIEYAYFQFLGTDKMKAMLPMFLKGNMPVVIKEKIRKLNLEYMQERISDMEDTVKTLENFGNDNINIAYVISHGLTLKLNKTLEKTEEIDKLRQKVHKLHDAVKTKLAEYVTGTITRGEQLFAKDTLSSQEIREAVKIVQMTSVYNGFIAEDDSDGGLQPLKEKVETIAAKLNNKVLQQRKNKKYDIRSEIASFDNIREEDVDRFGSKTVELAVMSRLLKNQKNVSVPSGIGLSANLFEMFFDSAAKMNEYNSMNSAYEDAVRQRNYDLASRIGQELVSFIRNNNNIGENRELRDNIEKMVDKNKYYSVRTSGVGEDGANNAFAGMGKTNLNVAYDKLFEMIQDCWVSFYSERSIKYMAATGKTVKPALIIEEMADDNIEISGVMFSRNKSGNGVIEAVYGLGEGLVSSLVTPDTVEVDLHSKEVLEYSVANKNLKVTASDNGVEPVAVTKGQKERALNNVLIKRLSEILITLERDAGYPVDVEFAIGKDGVIHILQRRAITTFDNKTVNIEDTGNAKYNIAVVSGNDYTAGKEVLLNVSSADLDTGTNEEEAVKVYF